MAYNTKPIVTDVDGNPVSQYYNPTTDQYEPVEGSGGGNKVVLYNADGTENNSLSLIPILEKLSELTGTVIDEQTRQSNEQQRITFYNQLVEMLNTGQLKGDKGDTGETGRGLEFDWDGTRLGVRVEGDEEYIYVDLRGPQGPPGEIENLTSQHIEDTLGYLPVSPNDLEEALNEIYQDLIAHKAENVSSLNGVHGLKIESGTWTPYFYGGTTAGTPTYTIQSGTYYKIGNLVYINARLQLSSKGGMEGPIFIGGLPFNPSIDHNAISIGEMSLHALSKLALVGNVRASGRIEVKQYDATTISYLNDASITDSFYIMLSAIYRVNA